MVAVGERARRPVVTPVGPDLPVITDWAREAPCTRALAEGNDLWGSSDYRDRLQATATCVRSSCLLPCAKYAATQKWAGVVIAGWSAPEANGNRRSNAYPGLDKVLAHYAKYNARQMKRAVQKAARQAQKNPDHGVSGAPGASVRVAS